MEELLAFRSVSCPLQGQDILLAMVAASVSYEYNNAPNITLALSDVPYAKLLRVHTCSARYSILEAPGKVKFISFPGTHNWRTRWVDMQFSQTTVQVWSDVVEGVTADGRQLHGGRRKVWEYKIHSGFDQEAKEVGLSLQSLIDDIRNGYRLVLSGHSLGGVVAQHITLQLLNLHPELFLHADKSCPPPLSCVTLGSPLLGNYQLVDAVVRSGWNDLFHNFVYRSDIVPRLSCGDELVWDSTAAVMERVSSAYRNVWNWFQWRSTEETTTAQPATPPPPAVEESTEGTVPNTEEKKGWAQFVPGRAVLTHKKLKEELNRRLTDGATTSQTEDMQDRDAALGRYMDSAIRTGRDVLVKEEDKAMTVEEQAQRRAEVETICGTKDRAS
ncbi:class 3 lipase [Angomonas deanei]|nr:class 3 lipase [Angomonas deanei]|eukprot:EPY27714.1 class 3 lipase [Angomonas deanei]